MIDLGINLFQEIAALGGGGGGYSISNSLRFNDNDSAYLSWTPSSAGNRKTWTFSAWVKLGNSGATRTLFAARLATSNSDSLQVYLTSNDQINAGGVSYGITATPVLRDPSGWYHIVLSYDTTQATDTNRAKIYINGIQASVTGTYPSINLDTPINNTQAHNLGRRPTENDRYFDGYMAEVNFIDGQALTADDFGEIDATTGEWSPKRYSGTYGTNGFYLPFNGNANDSSGNGNNWTENNLASTDQMLDTPTNNFSVLNPLDSTNVGTAGSYSEGNLKYITSGNLTSNNGTKATMAFNSGKWYWENVWASTPLTTYPQAGILRSDINFDDAFGNALASTGGYGVSGDGKKFIDGASTSSGISWSTGDIVQIAVDMDNRYIYIGKNGVWQFSGVPTSGASGTGALSSLSDYYYAPIAGDNNYVSAATMLLNFGQDSSFAGNKTRQGNTDSNGIGDFYYTPPTGYLALCTENLPAPAIEQPETQFNVVLDTGANIKATAEALYDSSLIWIKDRVNSNNNQLIDTVRGTGVLQSNTTAAETTYSAPSGNSVAWVWKAGGTAVSNTDGVTSGVFTAVTSQVSANVDSGFSIQTYTAPASGKPSWGHGLGVTPKVLILKRRDGTGNWEFISPELIGASYGLRLNTTAAATNYTNNYAFFDSSKIDIGNATYNLTGSADYVAYTFAEVESFSKFGSYVGNGSADGPFVYTGFKPAFVLIKRTDAVASWHLFDNERSGYNAKNDFLLANLSDAEYSGTTYPRFDLLSNGFKAINNSTNTNASAGTYIYMAFAESPTKFSLGR